MKALRFLATACLIPAVTAACSTTESRIREHRAEFESYPPEVQKKIRDGRVDPGFTKEQVAIALGRPDRVYRRRTAGGTNDVWAYAEAGGRTAVGFGFGMSSGGWDPRLGGGMGVTLEDDRAEDRLRVVFENGVVVAVEDRRNL